MQVVLRATGSVPAVCASGENLVVEGLELQQCSGSPIDCVSVTKGSVCFRNVVIKNDTGSGLAASGENVAVLIQACTIIRAGKYGCFVSDQATVEAKDSTIDGCKAAGVVSRGRGSTFRADKCVLQNNGKSASLALCSLHTLSGMHTASDTGKRLVGSEIISPRMSSCRSSPGLAWVS